MAATCALTGTLINLDGTPMRFAKVKATLDALPGYGGVLFLSETSPGTGYVSAYTDKNGQFTLTLTQGVCFQIELPGVDRVLRLVVPSTDTARLMDHLIPRVVSVEWSGLSIDVNGDLTYPDLTILPGPDRVELAAGGTLNVCLRVTWSTGQQVAYPATVLVAAPNPGYATVGDVALAITQAVPGDVTISETVEPDPINSDSEDLPLLLLPAEDYDITFPSDLIVRFV